MQLSYLDKFQKIIITILATLMGLAVMLATLELGYIMAFYILLASDLSSLLLLLDTTW
jgi:hypothetical protein